MNSQLSGLKVFSLCLIWKLEPSPLMSDMDESRLLAKQEDGVKSSFKKPATALNPWLVSTFLSLVWPRLEDVSDFL